MDKRYADAKSVLTQWESDNVNKVRRYVKEHGWLRADTEKLLRFARENRICTLAVTATEVFGIDAYGVLHLTGRWNLGILDNYS